MGPSEPEVMQPWLGRAVDDGFTAEAIGTRAVGEPVTAESLVLNGARLPLLPHGREGHEDDTYMMEDPKRRQWYEQRNTASMRPSPPNSPERRVGSPRTVLSIYP